MSEKVYTKEEFAKLPRKAQTGCVKFPNGSKLWYKEGEFHRDGGPALESANGDKEWYKEGKLHREDGPAVEYAGGYKEYHLEGKRYSTEDYKWADGTICEPGGRKLDGTQKESVMTNSFMDMIKSDVENAAYRVAATQMSNVVKRGLIKILESKGLEGPKAEAVAEMLNTEIGSAMVSMLLGYGLKYAPKISEDPRAMKLSEEFRVKGMETIGNEVIGSLMEHLLPEVMNVLSSLPEAKADEKIRVNNESTSLDEVNEVRVSKKLSAVK